MKKMLVILMGLIAFLTVGCGRGSIEEITFTDYETMIENKESFILFIGSSQCNHCAEFKMTLDEVIEDYNVDFKYIDVHEFTEEEKEKFSENIRLEVTPTTVFIESGVDDSCNLFSCDHTKRIKGSRSYEEVVEMLKNKGYIKG